MRYFKLTAVIFFALVAGATSAHNAVTTHRPVCAFGDLRIATDFDAARVSQCAQTGKNSYTLVVQPEGKPINSSPWYAFSLSAERARTITLFLHYGLHKHRYRPKISTDGRQWALLDASSYSVILAGRALKLELRAGPEPVYISAQEIINNDDYRQWIDTIAELPYVEKSEIGKSIKQRPITRLMTNGPAREWVLLVGRQHPPEVTGALALLPFVEALLADNALTRQFLQRFNVMIIPNLNPDGVAEGHWRFNMNGADLNRDWGIFEQTETALLADALNKLLASGGNKLVLGLDFHSTKEDVFYTQEDDPGLDLPDFTREWLEQIQRQAPWFTVKRQATNNPGLPTFKTYISEHYNIPAITYEMGDQTDRKTIAEVARIAATEMKRILLRYSDSD